MHRITAPPLASFLAACAYARPDPVASPRLDSGVTSSNGGGMRVLGDDPYVSMNTRVTPVR
jgi:hypothetical protein